MACYDDLKHLMDGADRHMHLLVCACGKCHGAVGGRQTIHVLDVYVFFDGTWDSPSVVFMRVVFNSDGSISRQHSSFPFSVSEKQVALCDLLAAPSKVGNCFVCNAPAFTSSLGALLV